MFMVDLRGAVVDWGVVAWGVVVDWDATWGVVVDWDATVVVLVFAVVVVVVAVPVTPAFVAAGLVLVFVSKLFAAKPCLINMPSPWSLLFCFHLFFDRDELPADDVGFQLNRQTLRFAILKSALSRTGYSE